MQVKTQQELDQAYSKLCAERGHHDFQVDLIRFKQFELTKEADALKRVPAPVVEVAATEGSAP